MNKLSDFVSRAWLAGYNRGTNWMTRTELEKKKMLKAYLEEVPDKYYTVMTYNVLDVLATYMENTRQTNESRKHSYENCFRAGSRYERWCENEDTQEDDDRAPDFDQWWEYHKPVFHLDLGYIGYIEGCYKLGIPPHAYEDWLGATQSVPDVYTKLDEETRAYKEKSTLHKV